MLILPRRFTQQPQGQVGLTRPLTELWHGGNPYIASVSRRLTPLTGGANASIAPAAYGVALSVGGANNTDTGLILGQPDSLFGTTECTIAVFRRCRDTTARATTLFGYDSGASSRVLSHAPYSDGNIYWDYADATAGSGRVSTAYTKDTNPETLVYVAGTGVGRQIWRRGKLIASNAAATASRSVVGVTNFLIGGIGIDGGADNVDVYLFAIDDRAWTAAEIAAFAANPWSLLSTPRRLWINAIAGGGGVALTQVAATGAVGTVSPAITAVLSQVLGTGAVGTATPSVSPALNQVAATGAVGTDVASIAAALTQAAGTGAVGTLALAISVALTQAAATGSTGNVSVATGGGIPISGVSAAGSVGTLSPVVSAALSQVLATGRLSGPASWTGNGGGVSVSRSLTQAAGAGSVGAFGLAISAALTGAQTTGSLGTLRAAVSAVLTGTQATGGVGTLSLAISAALSGAAATGSVGLLVPSTTRGLTGVTASGLVGTLFAPIGTLTTEAKWVSVAAMRRLMTQATSRDLTTVAALRDYTTKE